MSKSLVYRYEPSSFANRLCEAPLGRGGKTSGEGARERSGGSDAETFGGVGGESDEG